MAGASRLAITNCGRRTQRGGSDMDTLIINYNKLALQVSWMMSGMCTTSPANKAGTTAATAWRTEIFSFTFRGLNVTTAAQEKALTAGTHNVAASKEAWFVLTVQANGTSFTVTKAADQTIGTVLLPTGVDNEVIVGYMQIVTGATGFVAATDNLTADGPKIASIAWTDAPAPTLIGNSAGVARTATT